MDDLDLLVRPDAAARTVTILRNLGWVPHFTLTEKRLRTVHSMGFRDREGRQLDLHWHLVPETCAPGADGAFWQASRPCREAALATAVLHPMDQLFQVCVHGVRWNRFPPFRWVADAVIILRALPAPDWDRLVWAAERHHLVLLMRRALGYVGGQLDAPVPADVLATLERLPVSRHERVEQWFRERAVPRPLLGNVPEFWFGWRRLAPDLSWPARLTGFPRYMRDRLEADGYGDLASGLLLRWRRAARRSFRRMRSGRRRASE
jgi:hypothetical protein